MTEPLDPHPDDASPVLTDEERGLLRLGADADVDPPDGAEARTWAALVGVLGPAAGGPVDPSTPAPPPPVDGPAPPTVDPSGLGTAATTAAALGTAKTTAIAASLGVLVGLAMVGGFTVMERGSSRPAVVVAGAAVAPAATASGSAPHAIEARGATNAGTTAAAIVSADPPPAPAAGSPADRATSARAATNAGHAGASTSTKSAAIDAAPAVAPAASGLPAETAETTATTETAGPAPTPAIERAQQRREEFELTARARAELRAGRPAAALATLAEAQQRVAAGVGVLGQEREVIAIEALAASGQSAVARQRAAAFLAAHPQSVHAARLAPFVSSPSAP